MGGVIGADLETLRVFHSTLRTSISSLEGVKGDVDRDFGNARATWTGANAAKFEEAWNELSAVLPRLRDALDTASTDVKTQHNNLAQATGESAAI